MGCVGSIKGIPCLIKIINKRLCGWKKNKNNLSSRLRQTGDLKGLSNHNGGPETALSGGQNCSITTNKQTNKLIFFVKITFINK